jgi:Tol biopolymer transport system component
MLPVAGLNASFPAIAGNRLVYADSPSVAALWRARLDGGEEGRGMRELVRSAGRESWPAYSLDGQRIAYVSDQTGTEEIWLCDADGGNRQQLTHFNGARVGRPRWSPDGRYLLISHDGGRGPGLYTITAPASGVTPLNGNKPVPVVPGGTNGSWSRDGKKVYFDEGGQVWRVAPPDGAREKVTNDEGTAQGIESLDGKYVYYRSRRSIWRVPVAGGNPEEAFVPEHDMFYTTLQPAKSGIYYLEWESRGRGTLVSFYDFAKKQSSVVLRMKLENMDRFTMSYSVSPDGRYIVYPRVDRNEANLMMVEHFR